LSHIKQILPDICKIIYFSDCAASQYKNYKNLTNLYHHRADFQLDAEWHFFATSHGKSPRDGIGSTVNRLTARASLQATVDHQITTPHDMFLWAEKNIDGIKFFYVTGDNVRDNEKQFDLDNRYLKVKTVAGTRSHHSFTPVSDGLQMRQLSADVIFSVVQFDDRTSLGRAYENYQPGRYVACVYDEQWYIGNIVERS